MAASWGFFAEGSDKRARIKMQSHPVPQNITGFEFKLIGFLTIRQFGYLAAAGILSFVIYILPLYLIVKAALIVPLCLLGLALAFVPVNDLPFDRWLVSFIRSVYSPTKRIWHKEPKEIGFLAPEFAVYLKGQQEAAHVVHSDRSKLSRYLARKPARGYSVLHAHEDEQLAKIVEESSAINFTNVSEAVPTLGIEQAVTQGVNFGKP